MSQSSKPVIARLEALEQRVAALERPGRGKSAPPAKGSGKSKSADASGTAENDGGDT